MMRLLSIVLLSFLYLNATAQSTSAQDEVRRWRLGFSLQSDNGYTNPYIRSGIRILPRLDRTEALVLAADYQVFAKLPILFVTSEFGYYQGAAGNNDIRWLAVNDWPGDPFHENTQIGYLHAGLGLRLEPFARSQFSPYLGWQLHLSIPRQLDYSFQSFSSPGLTSRRQLHISGGERLNQGWKFNFGLRAQLHPRWSVSLGIYHAYMAFSSSWAGLPERQFLDNIFMRLDTGGIELRCQYSL